MSPMGLIVSSFSDLGLFFQIAKIDPFPSDFLLSSSSSCTCNVVDGCWDGALEKVDQLLDWANEYGLSVLIDVHTMKDSQNGFDNSGQAMGLRWTSNLNNEFSSLVTCKSFFLKQNHVVCGCRFISFCFET